MSSLLVGDRLTSLFRPRTVAVVGASATRVTQGNDVIANLLRFAYDGEILPVHPTAESIDGFPAVNSIADLPPEVDVAAVCVPARGVASVLRELDDAGCRSAVVVAAGFSDAEAAELREIARDLDLVFQGPNCMGLINATDGVPLYTTPQPPLPVGPVAIVAQSGSAAVALSHSYGLGLSKIVTSGNQVSLTTSDYVSWLADDDATQAVGLVVETIFDPDRFEAAIARLHAAGKSAAVLKVGRSDRGAIAAQAHTGALVSRHEAYEAFLARLGVPLVHDYDEMVATLQCLAEARMPTARGARTAIVGISGGQGALVCDLASDTGVPLAAFSPETKQRIERLLPGARPENPLDYAASVGTWAEDWAAALDAVLADDGVDAVLVLQDAQSTLPVADTPLYTDHMAAVAARARRSEKPIVAASSTSSDSHPDLEALLDGVPLVRGAREALVAIRGLAVRGNAPAAAQPAAVEPPSRPQWLDGLRAEVAAHSGPLPQELTRRVLAAYDVPVVRSAVASDAGEAVRVANEIGYPLVVKVMSRQVPHRSDAGGVHVGIGDEAALRAAVAAIERSVLEHVPGAEIDGYEIQEHVGDAVEAVVGFTSAPPFGSLVLVGAGGTLVELLGDTATDLAPVALPGAMAMIERTRLGTVLGGYRNLIPRTDTRGLAMVVQRVSDLAADLGDLIAEADLNPVLIAPGTGRAVIVDALLVGGAADTDSREGGTR